MSQSRATAIFVPSDEIDGASPDVKPPVPRLCAPDPSIFEIVKIRLIPLPAYHPTFDPSADHDGTSSTAVVGFVVVQLAKVVVVPSGFTPLSSNVLTGPEPELVLYVIHPLVPLNAPADASDGNAATDSTVIAKSSILTFTTDLHTGIDRVSDTSTATRCR